MLGAVGKLSWRAQNAPDSRIRYFVQSKKLKPELAGLGAGERQILGALLAREPIVIRAQEVQEIHQSSRQAANLILSRLHKKGWLRRLRRGLYGVVPLESETTEPAIEDAWPLAMELFSPCFISGWTAAQHWDLTEQIFNTISLVTGHPQRSADQVIADVRFRTRTISPDRIFGTRRVWVGNHAVEIADRHRLIVDVLDAPDFGGGGRHTMDIVDAYWASEHHDARLLLDYALRYGRGAVLKRIGFSAERAGVVGEEWLSEVEAHLSKGVVRLDPQGSERGSSSSRWRVKVNLPLDTR